MKTKRLFKEDVYMKEAEAVITSLSETNDGKVALTLDRTIFFPTGGGQSCDRGTIAGFKVTDVYEDEAADDIIHIVDASPADFETGTAVYLILDWEHRFDNMQRHCGEHILSGMFFREYGGVNRGFHMGDQYMTIDISLEARPEFTSITWDMAKHAEECANDTYLGAWSSIPPQRPNRLSIYLGKITRNLALNRYKRYTAEKRGHGQVVLALSELEACIPSETTVEQTVEENELAAAIDRFLYAKPKLNRNIFVRRYYHLYAIRDIADAYGMSESKVTSLLFRMRNELRRFLEKEGIML